MNNIIFYLEYMKEKRVAMNKYPYYSKKYEKYCSIINRLTDWQLVDLE